MPRSFRTQLYRYIRKVAGRKFQARVWINDWVGHQNLGLYETEHEAWLAAKAFINNDVLPPNVLPKYVRRAADRRGYTAWVRARGHFLQVGIFDCPMKAHRAMVRLIARTLRRNERRFGHRFHRHDIPIQSSRGLKLYAAGKTLADTSQQ